MTTDVVRGHVRGPAGEVSYLEWTGDEGLAPVLCLHPVNTAAGIWSDSVGSLSRRVIAVDYRGHGRSAEGEQRYPSDFAADARAVADHLGLDRVHLLGGSIGGAVSVEFTAAAPERVASIGLFGATLHLGVGAADLAEMTAALRELGVREWFDRHGGEILGPQAAPGSAERLTQFAAEARSVETVVANIETTFGRADARPVAEGLRAAGVLPPVTVVVGAADPTCPPAMARDMAEALGTTAAAVRVLDGVGHLPMLEVPHRVAAIVESTLVDLP
ncbi:alpha/beta hydrolase [Gordonia desulfuricans]|uniref:Alpha/beta hydrolase n=1 Tax=Gordonia desulfuricans TaxID=89051 RepID=A0A7K3LIS6_9ACTN|nr:alpha/beta hydrolase [Gordonia desulfuricans]NDK88169.1 alpha/beta hydrolase [Gordonia desulfuricans]